MTKDELLALADKVEALEGPSREVDAEIAPLQGLRMKDEGHPLGGCYYDTNGHGVPLPAHTASLDAALTLVPKGWIATTTDFTHLQENVEGRGLAELYPGIRFWGDANRQIQVSAATPALALCAAALRARAQQEQQP